MTFDYTKSAKYQSNTNVSPHVDQEDIRTPMVSEGLNKM